ncbi:MAG: TraB/GumN family protein [Candidatus Woesearchaeota archaeon]
MSKNHIERLDNVKIVGTSHVSEESVESVKKNITEGNFDVVCVELDKERLYALSNNIKQTEGLRSLALIRHVGITGFIFAMIASIAQKKIGKKLDMQPGSDMMAAAKTAGSMNIPVALIDQDVKITLKNLSKNVKFREKMKIAFDLLKSLLGLRTPLNDIDKGFDLKKVPPDELIEKILKKTKDRYSGLYKVLVDDRNKVMTKRILGIMKKNPEWNVLVVVGAGHKEGMIEKLEEFSGKRYEEHENKPDKKEGKNKQRHDIIYSDSHHTYE